MRRTSLFAALAVIVALSLAISLSPRARAWALAQWSAISEAGARYTELHQRD